MNILVTGAKGFVGKNLVANLLNVKNQKDKTRNIIIDEVYEYDLDTPSEMLYEYCLKSDFIFNLAGVNRPKDPNDFMQGNFGFASTLLDLLIKINNTCPIMLASSIQATLQGRYNESDYGKSKLAGENLFFEYGKKTGAQVLVYRFPNLFGKWCKPNYNSVVATFCNNIANELPIQINDNTTELELLYIDDLIDEMFLALVNKQNRCDYNCTTPIPNKTGKFCFVPTTYKVQLGKIVSLLTEFHNQSQTLLISDIPNNSFEKKLYSTYLSYLPVEKICFPLTMNIDNRGSFTELLKTNNNGQFSVNISNPGITKGEHWHNTKWEFFIVVSGHGLIQERNILNDEVLEFEVSGDKIQVIHMIPGYTHNIINLSKTENLITLMWANELFDKNHPDTFMEKVKR